MDKLEKIKIHKEIIWAWECNYCHFDNELNYNPVKAKEETVICERCHKEYIPIIYDD